MSPEIFDLLTSLGANLETQDFSGATALDIWKLTHFPSQETRGIPKLKILDKEKVTLVSESQFFPSNKDILFISQVKRRPFDILDDWLSKKIATQSRNLKKLNKRFGYLFLQKNEVYALPSSHEKLSDVEPNLYLKEVSFGTDKKDSEKDFGVFSSKYVEVGTVLMEYPSLSLNKESGESFESDEYSYATIDGTYIRGYASYVNDCTPNIVSSSFYYKGAKRLFEFALRDIKKGEQICKNYLTHQIKFLKYKNLSQELIERTISNSPDWLFDMVKKVDKLYDVGDYSASIISSSRREVLGVFDGLYAYQFLLYVFGTNAIVLRLFAEDKITSSQLSYVLENCPFLSEQAKFGMYSFDPPKYIKDTIPPNEHYFGSALFAFSEFLSKLTPGKRKYILNYIKSITRTEPAYVNSVFMTHLPGFFPILESSSGELLMNSLDVLWVRIHKNMFDNLSRNPSSRTNQFFLHLFKPNTIAQRKSSTKNSHNEL